MCPGIISISHYVNCDDQDVLIIKKEYWEGDHFICFIKKEENWVEIKPNSDLKLEERAEIIEEEAGIKLEYEIRENNVIDKLYQKLTLYTVDYKF